jgi:hypothetical protein
MKACIPTNNSLTKPLKPFVNFIEGGIGGILFMLILVLMIFAIIRAVIFVVQGARVGTALGVVISIPLVVFGGILAIALFETVLVQFNHLC